MNEIMLYIVFSLSVLFSSVAIIVAIFNRKRIKQRKSEIDHNLVRMPYDREIFEKNLISMTDAYTITPSRYEDYYQILLPEYDILPISKKIYNNSFFEAMGIDLDATKLKPNKVCCLLPFYPTFRKMYDTIASACAQCGMSCVRTDDEYVMKENLTKNILRSIIESSIIIAVLDGKNPNVTYEVGIAHALGKPVILVIDIHQIKQVPLHFRDKQMVCYRNQIELEEKLVMIVRNLKKQAETSSQENKFMITTDNQNSNI